MKHIVSNPAVTGYLTAGNVDEAMRASLRVPSGGSLRSYFARDEGERLEGVLYGGLTFGDFLYDYVRIDPTVVEGVDFSRSEDLHSIFNFSLFAKRLDDLSSERLVGSVSQMQGYVAERLVAHHLEAQGHDVVFPSVSNQEGWDVLVDGAPFQIKNLATAAGVHEHLQRFHDIPVIVNADLAGQVGHLNNVYVDPMLQHDQVLDLTEQSLHSARELADFEIPWISLAVSSAASLRDLVNHHTDLNGAVINALSNTAGRIAVGKVGSVTSGMLGLLLFGPAGSVVFSGAGAVVGAYWGRKAAGSVRSLLVGDLAIQVRNAARDCAATSVDAMRRKVFAWREKQAHLQEAFSTRYPVSVATGTFLDRKMIQDISYLENKMTELEAIANGNVSGDAQKLWEKLVVLARRSGIHPHFLQDSFKRLEILLRELQQNRRKYRI
ncbi:hypothetical protein [Geomonas limicola]|nr:hypothetical protein [Geomonas limicola]